MELLSGYRASMFKENNVKGKHVSFQANTKWNLTLSQVGTCLRKTCFISGKYEMNSYLYTVPNTRWYMFKENNVSGKHVSFQVETK